MRSLSRSIWLWLTLLVLIAVAATALTTSVAQASPNAWTSADINAKVSGATTLTPSTAWVKGSGADIWGTSDGFRYVYNSTGGDFEFAARVSQWNGASNDWSKAGLMIRASTASNAAYAMVNVTGKNGLQLQWRSATGGGTSGAAGTAFTVPVWLKLRKAGSTLTAYSSTDGATWTQIGTPQTVSLGTTFLYGMAVTSHSDGWYADATFDSIYTSADIGTPSAGQTNLNNGNVWVRGSGADVWGTSDGFRLVSNTASGDIEWSAKVVQWNGASNDWSKAGLMLRDSSAANAAYAMVAVTGKNGLQFQWRSAAGGSSSNTNGPAFTVPVWLKLRKAGSTLTAYSSTDGATWSQIGSGQSVPLSSVYQYGFAVTSHANGAFADATFASIRAADLGATPVPSPTQTGTPQPTQPPSPTPLPTPTGLVVTVNRAVSDVTSQLRFGATHTLASADPFNNAAAVTSARALLQAGVPVQNQHIMGWGAANPEPSNGVYDWGSLDNRVNLMRQTGATIVLTVCCAPDWMKGGAPGTTDWNNIEAAPYPQYYANYADLARKVALRYPDVQYFQIWNQMKGFWDNTNNRWDYVKYTQLYNAVYDAIKSANPNAKIGGPYIVMDTNWNRNWMSNPSNLGDPAWGWVDQRDLDVISYWLANKHGGDFLSVNAGVYTRDAGVPANTFAAEKKFADITAYLKTMTSLPIWWAEWEATNWGNETLDHNNQNALMATAMIHMARSGATLALKWQPQGDNSLSYQGDQESVWSDTRVAGGGQPFPFYNTVKAFKDYFGPGTLLFPVTVSAPGQVAVLASTTKTMLVNQTGSNLTLTLNGVSVILAPYEVRVQ